MQAAMPLCLYTIMYYYFITAQLVYYTIITTKTKKSHRLLSIHTYVSKEPMTFLLAKKKIRPLCKRHKKNYSYRLAILFYTF